MDYFDTDQSLEYSSERTGPHAQFYPLYTDRCHYLALVGLLLGHRMSEVLHQFEFAIWNNKMSSLIDSTNLSLLIFSASSAFFNLSLKLFDRSMYSWLYESFFLVFTSLLLRILFTWCCAPKSIRCTFGSFFGVILARAFTDFSRAILAKISDVSFVVRFSLGFVSLRFSANSFFFFNVSRPGKQLPFILH